MSDPAPRPFEELVDLDELVREQERLGSVAPPSWTPGAGPLLVGGAFVAFARGEQGPGRVGDRAHVGAALGLPSVGVTHRPLSASGPEPPDVAGVSTELRLDGAVVGRWLRTRCGVRPLAVHAGWRTDDAAAVEVVMRCVARARTPEPLRLARMAAREARSAEARYRDRP